VALALASYQAGRGDLSAVLAARREAVETGLRLIDLDMQRAALSVRLTTLISEQ
jgi:outer membrane protein, heavy metal efflux system